MGKSQANLRQISGKSWADPGHILGNSRANLWPIPGKSWVNHDQISGKSLENLRCISDISQVYFKSKCDFTHLVVPPTCFWSYWWFGVSNWIILGPFGFEITFLKLSVSIHSQICYQLSPIIRFISKSPVTLKYSDDKMCKHRCFCCKIAFFFANSAVFFCKHHCFLSQKNFIFKMGALGSHG